MKILVPTTITDSMILAGTTIAEPASGETAWVSAGTYVVGDFRIRTTTHRVYKCVQASTGRTSLPEVDAAYWLDYGPTKRYAVFDAYVSTPTTGVTSFTYVLQPGFFNGLSFYGAVGTTLAISIKDAPGGSVIYSSANELFAQAAGLYELLFTPLQERGKLVIIDIPISPTAELTITISGGAGDVVALGMINVGDWRAVIGEAEWGGTEQGASAEPKTYSYIKFNDDGTTSIVRRGASTDMRGSVAMPAASADYAISVVQQVLDVPVSIVATDARGYDYLNLFGLVSASLTAETANTARLNYSVKGFI